MFKQKEETTTPKNIFFIYYFWTPAIIYPQVTDFI